MLRSSQKRVTRPSGYEVPERSAKRLQRTSRARSEDPDNDIVRDLPQSVVRQDPAVTAALWLAAEVVLGPFANGDPPPFASALGRCPR